MSDKFIFEWNVHSDGFLSWLLPNLFAGVDREKDHRAQQELIEHLSDLTEKWTKVELGITINGVPMPTQQFVEGIQSNMDYYASKEAARLLADRLPQLSELQEKVRDAEKAMKRYLGEMLTAGGIELPYDWDGDEW